MSLLLFAKFLCLGMQALVAVLVTVGLIRKATSETLRTRVRLSLFLLLAGAVAGTGWSAISLGLFSFFEYSTLAGVCVWLAAGAICYMFFAERSELAIKWEPAVVAILVFSIVVGGHAVAMFRSQPLVVQAAQAR